jgi:hypothetical protein
MCSDLHFCLAEGEGLEPQVLSDNGFQVRLRHLLVTSPTCFGTPFLLVRGRSWTSTDFPLVPTISELLTACRRPVRTAFEGRCSTAHQTNAPMLNPWGHCGFFAGRS